MNLRPTTNHNVYIIGAGFSRDAGFPLILDFIDRMADCQEWLENQGGREAEIEAIDSVFRFQHEAISVGAKVNLNPNNIEDLFSLASASFNPKLIGQLKTAVATTIDYSDKMKTLRSQELRLSISGQRDYETRFDPYNNYLRLMTGSFLSEEHNPIEVCRNPNTTFITFNYDTMLEFGLEQIQMPYNYGFKRSTSYSPTVQCSTDGTGVSLLKIHGSVNWGDKTIFKNYDELKAAGEQPLLIPPTWEKRIESKLLDVWKKAINSLNRARNIVIIGFSMPPTDVHFKYLIAAGLRDNISLRRIIFANPALIDDSETEDDLKRNVYRIFRSDLAGVSISFKKLTTKQFLGDPECLREIDRLSANNKILIVN